MKRLVVAACLLASSVFAQTPVPAVGPDRVEKLIEELTNAAGVSGNEGEVRKIMAREMKAAGADVQTDGLGSVLGTLKGPEGSPKIMLAAHMDELGAIVKYVGEDGFVRILPIGGWWDQALIDKRWVIHTAKGPVHGVTGLKSVHIATGAERERVIPRDSLFIDIGARNKAEAEALGVVPGVPITPDVKFTRLSNGAYTAKAFDDRLGCAVMLEAVRRLSTMKHPNTIVAVGTVQEEIGSRGAITAAHLVKPDIGIAVEVGVAGDHPGTGPDQAQERLGRGPGLFLHDASMFPNAKLRDWFFSVAREKQINLQPQILSGYGQDASQIQRAGTGTPTVNFTVPVRYLHTFNGVIRREDFDKAVELLVEALMRLDATTAKNIQSFD